MRTSLALLALLPISSLPVCALAGGGHIDKLPDVSVSSTEGSAGLTNIVLKNSLLSAREIALLEKARRTLLEGYGVEALDWPVQVNVSDATAKVTVPSGSGHVDRLPAGLRGGGHFDITLGE